ncbi:hypothetical protein A2810_00195 [candidate division Kazan bacterium RIFCSPHIGHO2_01_FULL_49_10]|uniref:Uncharacterized protein n=1 Tax=candidate division Kazan bacterium RIFCSPLOWO2_01_FULL_48_13 TaxID=1798539 RepID=A0A1F4PPR1_UNCK3|nr:MAG: hypothetical protein A2810_00195 [candidate division Kazan bacterium RIFCSPHIGHO2_01_FULL_49_10]OGB85570.1 MAG: hypothetical protein A2994_00910 [candidate division Kazan bacterium RIFCSPLOWO2_01_FULL_48_13]
MDEIRIEGQGPFHFPGNPNRKVEKVEKISPSRPDEDVLHKPEGGIHKTEPSGDKLDISQEALDALADADQAEQ